MSFAAHGFIIFEPLFKFRTVLKFLCQVPEGHCESDLGVDAPRERTSPFGGLGEAVWPGPGANLALGTAGSGETKSRTVLNGTRAPSEIMLQDDETASTSKSLDFGWELDVHRVLHVEFNTKETVGKIIWINSQVDHLPQEEM